MYPRVLQWDLDQCHICNSIEQFCCTTYCDKIATWNCAWYNCNKLHKQTRLLHHFPPHNSLSLTESANCETVPILFLFFWVLRHSLYLWSAIQLLTLCKLLQLQHAQLHMPILLHDKVVQQNRVIKSQVRHRFYSEALSAMSHLVQQKVD